MELEVRELVRRRGIDPVTDRAVMRRLVDEVVADYDERTLTSTLPPLTDPRAAAKTVYDAVAGFGPLQRHLDDREVEEIWINERLTDRCSPRFTFGRPVPHVCLLEWSGASGRLASAIRPCEHTRRFASGKRGSAGDRPPARTRTVNDLPRAASQRRHAGRRAAKSNANSVSRA